MAKPQIEDGHVKIANEVVDRLACINLPAYEWRVLWLIWRKTYGWHGKKVDLISFSQFQSGTGLDRRHVARALTSLHSKNIITITSRGNRRMCEYGFQKNYDEWLLPDKVTHSHLLPPEDNLLPLQDGLLPDKATQLLPDKANTIARKHSTKAITKARVVVPYEEILSDAKFMGEVGTDYPWYCDKDFRDSKTYWLERDERERGNGKKPTVTTIVVWQKRLRLSLGWKEERDKKEAADGVSRGHGGRRSEGQRVARLPTGKEIVESWGDGT